MAVTRMFSIECDRCSYDISDVYKARVVSEWRSEGGTVNLINGNAVCGACRYAAGQPGGADDGDG